MIIKNSTGNQLVLHPITVADVISIKTRTGVDFFNFFDEQEIDKLSSIENLLSILAILAKKEENEIAQLLDGELIGEATKAIVELVINFSPSPSIRKNLPKKLGQIWENIEKEIERKIDAI